MRWALIPVLMAGAAQADTVLAARTLRPAEILGPSDIRIIDADTPGTYSDAAAVLGQEARVVLYAGRAIPIGDVRPPALIGRNDAVALVYHRDGLEIIAEGRALGRAAAGELIDVLNSASHQRLTGRVLPDGRVRVD